MSFESFLYTEGVEAIQDEFNVLMKLVKQELDTCDIKMVPTLSQINRFVQSQNDKFVKAMNGQEKIATKFS